MGTGKTDANAIIKAKDKSPENNGKIITPEQLEKEAQEEKKELERYSKEFIKQYNKWKKVDEWSEYEWCDFDHADYLLRLFKMDISSFKRFTTVEYKYSKVKNKQINKSSGKTGYLILLKGVEDLTYSINGRCK